MLDKNILVVKKARPIRSSIAKQAGATKNFDIS